MFLKSAIWLLVLASLCLHSAAGGLPGGIERVLIWYMYELARAYKGINQSFVFPDWATHKTLGTTPKVPPTGKDKEFTFQELISNLDGKTCTVEGPGLNRDTLTVARELQAAGFDDDVKPKAVNRGLEGKHYQDWKMAQKTNKNARKMNLYMLLHASMADMMEKLQVDPEMNTRRAGDAELDLKIRDRVAKSKTALTMVVSIRTDDFEKFIFTDLIRARDATRPNPKGDKKPPVPNPGVGLDENDVVFGPDRVNEFDGKTYKSIDVDATLKVLKKKGADKDLRRDFKQFVANYGKLNIAFEGTDLKFTDSALTHLETLDGFTETRDRVHAC